MIRIDKVTTRAGDTGQTGLGDGSRIAKDAARIEAIGAVDEANAALGLVRLHVTDATLSSLLTQLQNDLFDVGADLCVPGEGGNRLRLQEASVLRLDAALAGTNAALPPLTSFVLPGGTPEAAHAHLARTIARRAERRVVHLAAHEAVNPAILQYLNRLSDLLFVLSRQMNAGDESVWVPGGVSRPG